MAFNQIIVIMLLVVIVIKLSLLPEKSCPERIGIPLISSRADFKKLPVGTTFVWTNTPLDGSTHQIDSYLQMKESDENL